MRPVRVLLRAVLRLRLRLRHRRVIRRRETYPTVFGTLILILLILKRRLFHSSAPPAPEIEFQSIAFAVAIEFPAPDQPDQGQLL